MNKGFMGPGTFGIRLGQPTKIMVRAGGFRAFGADAYFAAPPEQNMMPEPWQADPTLLGRGGGGGGGGARGRGMPHGPGWSGDGDEGVICGPGEYGPNCGVPLESGMGTRVLGSAVKPPKRHSMGAGFEGIEVEPSAARLCDLLNRALAVDAKNASGPEWSDFFSALERLRPLEMENEGWRAKMYHQMAVQCPDAVERLRSIRGAARVKHKCVKVTVLKNPNQVISTMTEPYQTRGWSIVKVPIQHRGPRPLPAQRGPRPLPAQRGTPMLRKEGPETEGPEREMKPIQQYEVWACPPGEEIPKKVTLSALEAADLVKSLDAALGPVKTGTPEAASCVNDVRPDLAVTERLLEKLHEAVKEGGPVDVTQDHLDAAKKVVDCASTMGVKVAAVPGTTSGGISTLATVGIVGAGAGALALFVL